MRSNPLAELAAIQWCRDKEITVNYIEKPGKICLYFNGQLLMEGDTLRNAIDKVTRYSRVELPVKQEQKEGFTLEATSGYVQSGNEEERIMSDQESTQEEAKQILENMTQDELIELIEMQLQTAPLPQHEHSFVYLLNQNHTALRGCACGLTFVGLMAGPNPDALCWHRVKEEEEL